MKLDLELVRQIMFSIGDETFEFDRNNQYDLFHFKDDLLWYGKSVTKNQILGKHIEYCIKCYLISGVSIGVIGNSDYRPSIVRLTVEPLGYEFLSNIRKNEVWEKLKSLDFQNLSLTECLGNVHFSFDI